ncbi:Uncharacterised protein [Mycobacteroides abscessus subsp. abscessus]|nr:Uncharacterised protein [Mycobacteroides abscessus subsp. abscessus]
MALQDSEIHDIELALGRTLTDFEKEQANQFAVTAQMLIDRVAAGVDLDPAVVAVVIREAVAARLRVGANVGQTRLDVQVDDARVTRQWSRATNGVEILPEWWGWLGLEPLGDSGAFTILPYRGLPTAPWVDTWRRA